MGKKKILLAFVFFAAISLSFAEGERKLSLDLGGLLSLGSSMGSRFEDTFFFAADTPYPFQPEERIFRSLNLALDLFARLHLDFLTHNLCLQGDIRFCSNSIGGSFTNLKGSSSNFSFRYKSIDFPLLVVYELHFGRLILMPECGVYLSVPVGKVKFPSEFGPSRKIDTFAVFGAQAGISIAYSAGPGALVGGIRYVNDFTSFSVEGGPFMLRRGLYISGGYIIPLN